MKLQRTAIAVEGAARKRGVAFPAFLSRQIQTCFPYSCRPGMPMTGRDNRSSVPRRGHDHLHGGARNHRGGARVGLVPVGSAPGRSTPARWYIRASERWATRFPHRVVTDSRRVEEYYRARYGASTNYIAYGAEPVTVAPGRYLAQYGLTPGKYVLFVGRLVPENCAHHLVEAFRELATDFRCVIVGDAPYAAAYIGELRATRDPRVVFTGYLFGEGYRELASNAYCFVETSEVGGTHPAVLEAMAFGRSVVVNDTPENLETIGEAGFSYDGAMGAASLRRVLERLLKDPALVRERAGRAQERVRTHYSWEAVADAYEGLFWELLGEAR